MSESLSNLVYYKSFLCLFGAPALSQEWYIVLQKISQFGEILSEGRLFIKFSHESMKKDCTKAELPQEGILFALNFLPWKFLLIKNLDFEKTMAT